MMRLLPGWLGTRRLDPVLIVLLLVLTTVGLGILYSASNQDMGVVYRQGVRLGIGFVGQKAQLIHLCQLLSAVLLGITRHVFGFFCLHL